MEAVCGLYRRFGYERLFVTATVERDTDLRAVRAAIGADGMSSCAFTRSP